MSHGVPCLLAGPLPAAFERRSVVIAAGGDLAYDEDDWRDALVVVQSGRLEVEGRCGSIFGFASGAVLWLTGLPLRTLRNPGDEETLLLAISRRSSGASAGGDSA